MDVGTVVLVCVGTGLLLGAASSVVTRRVGARAGVLMAVVVVSVGLVVIAARGEGALFPVVGAMLAFTVAASLFDPRPQGLFR